MKAKELMIGDLLTFRDCVNDPDFPILRVDRILPDSLFIRIDNSEADDEVGYEDIVGISLTPEMLEKNGFHETESNRYFPTPRWVFMQDGSRDGVIIEITFYQKPVNGVNVLTKIHTQSSKDGGVNRLHSCDIETVHELQHALRLCGIEKEIEL